MTTSVDGVIALATGLQGRFAQSYGNFAYMAGLVTDEFASTSAALISISDAEQGAVPSGTGDRGQRVQLGVSHRSHGGRPARRLGVARLADSIRERKSGLRGLAYALKAEALGEALQSYQKIPIKTYGETAPVYVARGRRAAVRARPARLGRERDRRRRRRARSSTRTSSRRV